MRTLTKFSMCNAVAAAIFLMASPSHAQEGYVSISGTATFSYGDPANPDVLADRSFTLGTYMPVSNYDPVSISFSPNAFFLQIEDLWANGETYISSSLALSAPPRVDMGGLLQFTIPAGAILYIPNIAQSFTGTNVDASGFANVATSAFPISMTGVSDVLFVLNFRPDAPIPEPATWALMIAGFGLVGFAARRRRVVAA